jgi:hypothetical protein
MSQFFVEFASEFGLPGIEPLRLVQPRRTLTGDF